MTRLERPAPDVSARAEVAAVAVHTLFGRRLLGVPASYLPVVAWPGPRTWRGPWHLWWLAHHLDCLVDASLRARKDGAHAAADRYAARAHRLLRTIRMRNVLRFTNAYYDDMGWLLLATQRLHALDAHSPAARLATVAARSLVRRLDEADTPALGGGLWWSTARDFKNAPATGPAAIFAARIGDTARARRLLEWMYAVLRDPDTGLYRDGVRVDDRGRATLVCDVYTYNQGLVLGALVELGDPGSLQRAGELVGAVHERLAPVRDGRLALVTHGGHDGGLFTGILTRYLALAATCPGLDDITRARAAELVVGTAEALWQGRAESVARPGLLGGVRAVLGQPDPRVPVFSPDPHVPAAVSQPPGIPLELSTQVQAWMVFEAAATLAGGPQRPPPAGTPSPPSGG